MIDTVFKEGTHRAVAVPHLEHDPNYWLAGIDIKNLDLIGQRNTRLFFNHILADELSGDVYPLSALISYLIKPYSQ